MDQSNNPAIGATVVAAGHRTNYLDAGSGEPLILLHGSGPGVSAYSNWRSVIAPLARSRRVLALDIAGFGWTEFKPDGEYGIKLWVSHLFGFMDALGIESASLVGNSFGGGLALAATLKDPARVRSLVLLGTPAGRFETSEAQRLAWTYEPTGPDAMRRILERFPYDPSFVTDEMVALRYETSARPGAQDALRTLLPAPADDGSRTIRGVPEESLRAIERPALVLHGRDDAVIPMEIGVRLHTNIADSELHTFGRCGHWVQEERSDAFVSLVLDFVDRREAAA